MDFSGVGDPSDDLRIMRALLPGGVRNVVSSVRRVDDATWARGRGRALAQALVQLPYYRDMNPVLAANARQEISEILTDHEHTT